VVGEIDFPVGKPINEVHVWFGGVRIVFELEERVEPDLYIDLSDFDYQDADVNRSHPDVKKRRPSARL